MSDPIVDPSTPADPSPAAPAPVDDGSLAQHIADTTPAPVEGDESEPKAPRGRHRARSQQAGPEDVPRIRELTKKLRETEDRLKEVESRTAPKPQEAPKPRLRAIPEVAESSFAEKEPVLEDFSEQADPYLAHARALAAYDRKKERFEEQQTNAKKQVEEAQGHNQAEMRSWFQSKARDFGGRLDGLIKSQPEAKQILEAAQSVPLTDAMHAALLFDEQGERVMLHIAQNLPSLQSQMDELYLMTDGKPVSETLVALVQRRMNGWMQAAATGSATPAPVKVNLAPRPPNPVRTAPSRAADQAPGEEDSLAAHAKFYGHRK